MYDMESVWISTAQNCFREPATVTARSESGENTSAQGEADASTHNFISLSSVASS